eukprot:1150678-Pelagomonas_calceolata.AAC.2
MPHSAKTPHVHVIAVVLQKHACSRKSACMRQVNSLMRPCCPKWPFAPYPPLHSCNDKDEVAMEKVDGTPDLAHIPTDVT